jgi:alpha-soluble NSF attachment protein
MCPQLEGTREQKLIQDLIIDFNEREVDNFSDHVFRFDEILKLDNWTAKVLLDIKNSLEKGGDDDDLQLQ